MQKAAREAKTNSNWLRPNEAYENALMAFVDAILAPAEDNAFLRDFKAFQKRIAAPGAVNALGQALLKITSPGVPDFYQGSELWDFSLVDPDNRRPVDFARRISALDELKRGEAQDLPALLKELVAHWDDGRIKLYLTCKALNLRRTHSELFQCGEYIPVEGGSHVCAFARRLGGTWTLAAVPRLVACVAAPRNRLLDVKVFGGDALALSEGAPRQWRNVLTGEEVQAEGGSIPLAALFAKFPVALLAA
jgi:(1->4)-alpha-D-glucan 1-alpha-D-glucosylmutase